MERGWEFWKEMASQEVTPIAITLGCMVEELVMNWCSDDAWIFMNEVWPKEEHRSFVNIAFYSLTLKGFALTRQHDKIPLLMK